MAAVPCTIRPPSPIFLRALSPHRPPFSLCTHPLRPQGPPCCSLNTLSVLSPQRLSSYCWFFLAFSTPSRSLFHICSRYPTRAAVLDHSTTAHPSQSSLLCFIFLQSTDICLIVCLPQLDCKPPNNRGSCFSFVSAMHREEPGT